LADGDHQGEYEGDEPTLDDQHGHRDRKPSPHPAAHQRTDERMDHDGQDERQDDGCQDECGSVDAPQSDGRTGHAQHDGQPQRQSASDRGFGHRFPHGQR
jgi:hypothetical protein